MSKVYKIGICEEFGNKINEVNFVNAYKGRGLENDRFFKIENDPNNQLTLIEKEQIDSFNKSLNITIPYINFRRNIVTEGILLNKLLGKSILIGQVKIKIHKLCEPCKHLQDYLKQNDLVKNLVHKGGLRCEILTNGEISIGDIIKY